MPESALIIANFFIAKGMETNTPVTPMKLQKLVYFAHGWSWGLFDKPLITETIYAWKFGPVIKEIYQEFSELGAAPINRFARGYAPFPSTDDISALLHVIWDMYGFHPGYYLSALTHKPDTPWSRTYDANKRDVVIPDDIIKAHYDKLAVDKGIKKPSCESAELVGATTEG